MRLLAASLLCLTVLLGACARGDGKLPQPSTDCGRPICAAVLPVLDAEGAPLPGATILIPFDRPIKLGGSMELAVVNAAVNIETRQPEITFAGVTGLRVDPKQPRQLAIEVDSFLADGSGIAFGAGVLQSKENKALPAFELTLTAPWSPLTVSLANVAWEATDRSIFSPDGLQTPKGATAEAAVREELYARLRARGLFTDEQVAGVLGQFDSEQAKRKIPDARVRAGLLMLWGTSAEYAIEFILADTNRRGVPFEPLKVEDLSQMGAEAAVFYHPLEGKLRLFVDREVALSPLELIAVVLAHEAIHSDLGGGSVTEEVLAMASDTRVYQEFLLTEPGLAYTPTSMTRFANMLTLAMLNSGRFGFPRPGILPRPGIDDALRGAGKEPARSFQDLLAKPHVYGDYNPVAGDVGSEVIEAYYRRITGNPTDQGKLRYDKTTLKLFDTAVEHGLTDAQLWQIVDTLKLRPVKIR